MKTRNDGQRGSALVLAVFVMFILTSMGVALLYVSGAEVQMSRANLRTSKAFFVAESGLEDGRMNLFDINGNGDFSDDLAAAAGANGTVDFDLANIEATYDSSGNFTGFTGYGDDEPVKVHVCSVTATTSCANDSDCPAGETCNKVSNTIGEGFYSVFLTNDPVEGRTVTADVNERVLLTGIGVGEDRSLEVAQAIISMNNILPSVPPAAITLLGPDPNFDSGTSSVKDYIGDDCDGSGGVPGLYVPVVGTVGAAAEAAAEVGVHTNPDFTSGAYTGTDTVADLTDPTEPTVAASGYGTIDDSWSDCAHVLEMITALREEADNLCTGTLQCDPTTPCGACDPTNTTPDGITFIDGNYDVSGNLSGHGTLVVTGELEFSGNTSWDGLILVLGEGDYYLQGGGNGVVSGGIIVADVAGPDGSFSGACSISGGSCWSDGDCPIGETCSGASSDNCTGGDNGFNPVTFDESGGGNSGTVYCTASLNYANPVKPYKIEEFRQW